MDLNTSVVQIIIKILFLIIFIISCYTSQRIGNANSTISAVRDIFESRPYDKNGDTYSKITDKEGLYHFFGNVLIAQIYDESQKEFPAITAGYHYLGFSNYFWGLRLTHNRAQPGNNTDEYTEELPIIRMSNYNGKSNMRQDNLFTNPFGSGPTNYTRSGGYKGKGGYVHYFDSNLTYDEANNKYNNLLQNGVFAGDLISIVIEVMLYNENYQVGANLAYEFMINNAGKIEKYKNMEAFYLSRYSSHYHQSSAFTQYFLMSLDILFFLGLLGFSFEIGLVIKRVTKELFKFGEINLFWYEVVDLIILILSYVSIVFWGLIVINPTPIKLPVDEKSFQKYIDLGSLIIVFGYIFCITIIFICVRILKLLTIKFPAFSALFDTVKIAFMDFVVWFMVISILITGFAYTTMFMVGTYDENSDNFLGVYVRLLSFTFGFSSTITDEESEQNSSKLFIFLGSLFTFVFSILLSKMLMTIVIIRYIYLRSWTQLYNEAISRITYKDGNLLYVSKYCNV